jgi:CRISPR-associated endonuclease/helicase Cas3
MGASWDVPVVVTTAVQFFESLHAARKKRCRKLPSLARAVIVLDEAQSLPLPLLRPCLTALRELIEGYGASVILSTATQPALTREGGFPAEEALEGAREIAPDPAALFRALKRVEVRDIGLMDDDALADRLRQSDQALIIVDNRVQARRLFDLVKDADGAAHLSTLMVPAHRRAVLAEVRDQLKQGAPVRLVSTSLIEAGVDVDFPLVLRAAAGIDSVAQAAGRCNREGNLDGLGRVELFRSEHPAPPAVEQFAVIGRQVLAEGHDAPIGEEAVASYFRRLWDQYGPEALDAVEVGPARTRGILSAIQKSGWACPYEQIEKAFRVIPDSGPSVIVLDGQWGLSVDALEELRFGSAGAVAKLVQPHSVDVPWSLWSALWDAGHVAWWATERFETQFAVLWTTDLYDARSGLSEQGDQGGVI